MKKDLQLVRTGSFYIQHNLQYKVNKIKIKLTNYPSSNMKEDYRNISTFHYLNGYRRKVFQVTCYYRNHIILRNHYLNRKTAMSFKHKDIRNKL